MLLILNRNNAISLIRTNSLIGTNYFLSGTGLFGLARMYCIVYNQHFCRIDKNMQHIRNKIIMASRMYIIIFTTDN